MLHEYVILSREKWRGLYIYIE